MMMDIWDDDEKKQEPIKKMMLAGVSAEVFMDQLV
jgi:hypothetical protein